MTAEKRCWKQLTARLTTLLVVAELLGGCTPKKSTDLPPDPRTWFIEAYDQGNITAKNDGKTYKARCDGHRTGTKPDQWLYDSPPSFPCTMAIEQVGAS